MDPAIPSRVLVSSSADFDSPFVGPLVSEGQVHAAGIDTVAVVGAGPRLRVTANYSYWHVSQLGLDKTWRPAEHELRHQGRVELLYRPADRWSTGFRWRYSSGRPYTPYDVKASIKAGRGVYDLARINTLDYPDYRRLDARVDRTFVAGRTATTAVLSRLDNVFDHDERAGLQLEPRRPRAEGGSPVGPHAHRGSEGGILRREVSSSQKPVGRPSRRKRDSLVRRCLLLASDNRQ